MILALLAGVDLMHHIHSPPVEEYPGRMMTNPAVVNQ
jgi:hypothetical protein